MSSLFLNNNISLAFFSPSPAQMMLVALVALLLYGGKLPEVARTWGKTFADFRRSLTGLKDDLNDVIYNEPEQIEHRDDGRYPNGYDDSEEDGSEEDTPDGEPDGGDKAADHHESNRKDDAIGDTHQQDPNLAALNQTGQGKTHAESKSNEDGSNAEKPTGETQKAD